MPDSGSGTGTPITPGASTSSAPGISSFPALSLESFRKIIGYNPYHFWGLVNSTVPVTSACNDIVKQYAWQTQDAAGRSQILEAIETAEARIAEHLGYFPAPRYVESTVRWPKYHDRSLWRYTYGDPDGRWIGVRLPYGNVQEIGTQEFNLLSNAAITPTDEDGDGLYDTFTATVTSAITDITQIQAFFIAADRLDGEAVGPRWRIHPLSISASGGTITIKGRYWLLVKPIKYEGVSAANLDPDTAANFVSQIAVYQVTTETEGETIATAQSVLLWETEPCHTWFCTCGACSGVSYTPADSSQDPAAVGKAVARAGIRDAVNGLVVPAQALRDSTTGIWSAVNWAAYREPDRVTVRYRAGLPLESDGQISQSWQTIITRLAAAELGRRICACDFANQELYHWQFDLARDGGSNDESYQVSADDLDNPLGTRRGHVYAWKQIKHLRLLQGLALL